MMHANRRMKMSIGVLRLQKTFRSDKLNIASYQKQLDIC